MLDQEEEIMSSVLIWQKCRGVQNLICCQRGSPSAFQHFCFYCIFSLNFQIRIKRCSVELNSHILAVFQSLVTSLKYSYTFSIPLLILRCLSTGVPFIQLKLFMLSKVSHRTVQCCSVYIKLFSTFELNIKYIGYWASKVFYLIQQSSQ